MIKKKKHQIARMSNQRNEGEIITSFQVPTELRKFDSVLAKLGIETQEKSVFTFL